MDKIATTCWFTAALAGAMLSVGDSPALAEDVVVPPHIALGERLFLETRFAYGFATLPAAEVEARNVDANAATAISCRSCHLVDEQRNTPGHGMRSYADFDGRSAIPPRTDGQKRTARNSQVLVNANLPRQGELLFHYDGEFASLEDLVVATLTGRNHGWLANERRVAVAHIADIIRADDGKGELASEFGGAYRIVLRGASERIPVEFRLADEYRIDVERATDEQIVQAVARLIAAYVEDLTFSRDEVGAFDGSPYDRFLSVNHLPRQPAPNETPTEYSRRLLESIEDLRAPRFVRPGETEFAFHDQRFEFGPLELAGLRLFLRQKTPSQVGSVGNCVACHPAPNFSDFRFHNTGVTQRDYDAAHGSGAFSQLVVPGLEQRNADYDSYLPPTDMHPSAAGRFRAPVSKARSGFVDLGLWNVFANPDLPKPQRSIATILCRESGHSGEQPYECDPAEMLPLAIARFKTPGLRNLGHSDPYMHSGSFVDLNAVVEFYVTVSQQARAGTMRNIGQAVRKIELGAQDVEPLVAFLRSLNEDYD